MASEVEVFNDVIEFIQTKKMELLKLSQRMSRDPGFKTQTERINSVVEVYDEIIRDLEKEFLNKK